MHNLENKTLCIDIDFTICRHDGDYATATPVEEARESILKLRKAGWIIVLFTARHFNHWKLTTDWLERHNFEYDQIQFGKPPARYYIDDRAIPFFNNWKEIQSELMNIK